MVRVSIGARRSLNLASPAASLANRSLARTHADPGTGPRQPDRASVLISGGKLEGAHGR